VNASASSNCRRDFLAQRRCDEDASIRRVQRIPCVSLAGLGFRGAALHDQGGNDKAVPARVRSTALFERFNSRDGADLLCKLLSAMRYELDGHFEKKSGLNSGIRVLEWCSVSIEMAWLLSSRASSDLKVRTEKRMAADGRSDYESRRQAAVDRQLYAKRSASLRTFFASNVGIVQSIFRLATTANVGEINIPASHRLHSSERSCRVVPA